MKIILSKNVKELSGYLTRLYGVFIKSRTGKDNNKVFFTACRKFSNAHKGGYWTFIRLCAREAAIGDRCIADIHLPRGELLEALHDAGLSIPPRTVPPGDLSADDLNQLIQDYSL